MGRDEQHATLREAIARADWQALREDLLAYAAVRLRRMGWLRGRDEEPSMMSADQLVQMAIEDCLEGRRRWDPTRVDLAGFLRGVVRSLTSGECKHHVRAKIVMKEMAAVLGSDATPPFEQTCLEEARRRELLDAARACAEGDADLEALHAAVMEGSVRPCDLAVVLGWAPERVAAARRRLQRRLLRSVPEALASRGVAPRRIR